jgi:methyl-accepting chemotaxis protein
MSVLRFFVIGRSLRAQVVMTMLAVTVMSVLGMAFVGYQRINAKIDEDLATRTLWALRVATRISVEGLSVLSIENDKENEPVTMTLTTPISVFDSFGARALMLIVDSIAQANRGDATIFRWNEDKKDFLRVATTLKNPDGSRATGTGMGQNNPVFAYMQRKEVYRGTATVLGDVYQSGYLPILDSAGKTVAVLFVGVGKVSELTSAASGFLRDLMIGSLVIFGMACLVTLFATGRVLAPLVRVANATNALASGSEGVVVPHCDRQDQVGVIARAVEGFSQAVAQQRAQERHGVEEAQRLAARKTEMDHLVGQFRHSVRECLDQLQSGAEKVRGTSQSIRDVVTQAATKATEGSNAAEDGANAISEVATATNQFASSITEIAARSNDAAGVVRKASETGKHAEDVASELANAVERISTAVAFISSIASQTNLLALNATIEAARAGDAGKGFAVVASEVKELSNGTSRAATEIAELVKSIEGVTKSVTGATREIGEGLTSINETTLVIAAAVTEQEQVTRDIATNADSAAQRSDIIRSGFEEVQRAIQNTADAAGSLDVISQEFSTSSDRLVQEIEDFLQRMAA